MTDENDKLLNETDNNKSEISTAIDLMASKKHKSTEEKKPKVTVGNVKSYKEHEIAVAINNFLSKNLSEESGSYLVGDNAARTMEYYGLKGHPVLGLVVAIGMCVVDFILKPKKKAESDVP